jgi:SAM-dependent methyltransferase
MVAYKLKVGIFKRRRLNALWRRYRARRGWNIGDYARMPDYVRRYAPGKTFADIGCMWGVNGEYSFVAAEAGATSVKAVDVFGPTPEFEAKRRERAPNVEFILGDATRSDTIARIGQVDVVFCAGVLYHHPSPFDLLAALRRLCRETLILRTATIPEVEGLPQAAVYFPMLPENARRFWDLSSLGAGPQIGINDAFDPREGYGNWFWGMTPSCVAALLATAGFQVEEHATEAFVDTFVCSAIAVPFEHRLPDELESRRIGAAVSAAGIARPA